MASLTIPKSQRKNAPRRSRPQKNRRRNRPARRGGAVLAENRIFPARNPTFGGPSGPSVRIVHNECVTCITLAGTGTDTDPEIFSFGVNPGIDSTFPWLSIASQAFQSYRINRMSFSWEPSIAKTVSGVVCIQPEYNVTDPPPSSISKAASNADAVQCAIHQMTSVPIKQANLARTYYVRQSGSYTEDPHEYDVARIHLLFGTAFAGAAGYLRVRYDVSLYQPNTIGDMTGVVRQSAAGQLATPVGASTSIAELKECLPGIVDQVLNVGRGTYDWTFLNAIYDVVVNGNPLTAVRNCIVDPPVTIGTMTTQRVIPAGSGNVTFGLNAGGLAGVATVLDLARTAYRLV